MKNMKKILKVDNPNVYAEYVGAPLLHPQLALISYDDVSRLRTSMNHYGVYGLFIQKQFPKYLSYGTKSIVVGDSSIIAVAPGQMGGAEDNDTPLYDAMGQAISHLDSSVNEGDAVLVTIITDGMENASCEYSGKAVKELVSRQREKVQNSEHHHPVSRLKIQ